MGPRKPNGYSPRKCVGLLKGDAPAYVWNDMFDPFHNGDQRAGRSEGLGLGLYIVQQIVSAHSGSVELQSQNGRTTFRVRLPRTSTPLPRNA